MKAIDLYNAGYRTSLQLSDEEVDKAWREAIAAYVGKVSVVAYNNAVPAPTQAQNDAAMQLAFILLLQRHAVATRSGGKTKQSPSLSENTGPSESDVRNADRLLRIAQAGNGGIAGEPSKLVDDIAHIYYRNVYMSL